MRWQTYFNYFYVAWRVDLWLISILLFYYYFANIFCNIKSISTNHHSKVSLFDFDEFEALQYISFQCRNFLFPNQLLSTTRRTFLPLKVFHFPTLVRLFRIWFNAMTTTIVNFHFIFPVFHGLYSRTNTK